MVSRLICPGSLVECVLLDANLIRLCRSEREHVVWGLTWAILMHSIYKCAFQWYTDSKRNTKRLDPTSHFDYMYINTDVYYNRDWTKTYLHDYPTYIFYVTLTEYVFDSIPDIQRDIIDMFGDRHNT